VAKPRTRSTPGQERLYGGVRELCLATLRELDYARLEKRAAEQSDHVEPKGLEVAQEVFVGCSGDYYVGGPVRRFIIWRFRTLLLVMSQRMKAVW
jgi:hypothetical protein